MSGNSICSFPGLSLNGMPSLQEKSLVIVSWLVDYNHGVVKIHIMARLVCVSSNSKSSNFRIALANTDSSSMFTKPCGKYMLYLFGHKMQNSNQVSYFVHYISKVKQGWFVGCA